MLTRLPPYVSKLALSTMASACSRPPTSPLILIIGATGTGKSQLAVDLAHKFNGEIINADAMQMYRGLPIVTNKMPVSERRGVRHHLLDEIGLGEGAWTVREFVRESERLIEGIRERGKVPVVVGGTGYYVFSLLFRDALVGEHGVEMEGGDERLGGGQQLAGESTDLTILDASDEEVYAKLREVDPVSAQTWHPRDRRKVQRALEVWLKTGRKVSDVYATQQALAVRFDPLIFWLDADDAVLKPRLNARVDAMVDQGLLEEVKAMRKFEIEAREQGMQLDQSKGVWVAIGYKELAPWLDALEKIGDNRSAAEEKEIEDLRHIGIEAIKSGTRQYAKRQNRWIRIRLAKALRDSGVLDKLFLLDCTDLETWDVEVDATGGNILQKFISGEVLPPNQTLSNRAARAFEQIRDQDNGVSVRQTHFCKTCDKFLMSEQEWTKHLRSQGHKKVLDGIRKRAQRELYMAKAVEKC